MTSQKTSFGGGSSEGRIGVEGFQMLGIAHEGGGSGHQQAQGNADRLRRENAAQVLFVSVFWKRRGLMFPLQKNESLARPRAIRLIVSLLDAPHHCSSFCMPYCLFGQMMLNRKYISSCCSDGSLGLAPHLASRLSLHLFAVSCFIYSIAFSPSPLRPLAC